MSTPIFNKLESKQLHVATLSIQMNQLPTSIDSYHNELQDKKLVKITDVFGREVKEEKNNLLFYIYEDGSVNKTYIIK